MKREVLRHAAGWTVFVVGITGFLWGFHMMQAHKHDRVVMHDGIKLVFLSFILALVGVGILAGLWRREKPAAAGKEQA